jgi:hypothetical protein
LDTSFALYGHHLDYPFIPANEFWIEREYLDNEKYELTDLAEDVYLDYNRDNAGYNEEYHLAHQLAKDIKYHPIQIKKNKIRQMGKISVWLVDGFSIRQKYERDFALGGHGLIYDFVPHDEIWLDNSFMYEHDEYQYILIHELIERYLMNHSFEYHIAHNNANARETIARRDMTNIQIKRFLTNLFKLNQF